MPEGHTIHALARRLERAFAGTRPTATSPQGRFVEGAAVVDGLTFEGADAYGKHLVMRFEGERLVHVHLGLFGKYSVQQRRGDPPVKGQVRLRLLSETHVADLRGATACELLTPPEWEAKAARIGADPLRTKTLPAATLAKVLRSRRPIGQILMDQSLVAGVGNVYRAELLHRLGLDPYLPGTALTPGVVQRLWEELVRLMPYGVETGRILVDDRDVRTAARLLREAGDRPRGARLPGLRPTYAVYRRDGEPCPRCGETVRKAELAARNLFWCPGCQVGLPDLEDPAVAVVVDEATRELVEARPDGSVCPSEVARRVAPVVGTPGWRDLMPLVRERAQVAARHGELSILRRGEVLDPDDPGAGPVRLATPRGEGRADGRG